MACSPMLLASTAFAQQPPKAPAREAAAVARAPVVEQPAAMDFERFRLANLSPQEFEQNLLRVWGERVADTTNQAGDLASFEIEGGGLPLVHVDRKTSVVSIEAANAEAWLKVLQAVDSSTGSGNQTRVVPLRKAEPTTILRAISLVRAAAQPVDDHLRSPHRKRHIGQFVSMIFQQEAGAAAAQPQPGGQPPVVVQPAPQPADGQPRVTVEIQPEQPAGPNADAVAGVADELGRLGNVQIEIIEGTGQIVIRGKPRDVERVLRIIEEIEQQSVTARPEVEIYYLKHLDSQTLNQLVTQVYSNVFAAQGTVTVVPLIKPNAVLLIGRKENIPPVVELIEKLDRPVAPESQLKVFSLKHMSAIDAERTIRTVFADRWGYGNTQRTALGGRINAIADFRTNSLIVQAGPRDMMEVTKLLLSMDIEQAPSTHAVRVFKLRNSVAEELAPIIQEAITGQQQGQQAQQVQQIQQGAGGGSAGEATPPRVSQRASSLQLLQIGENGQQILQSGILADMRVTADTRGNALIVVGPPSSMELMGALIQELDALPASEAQIKVFTIVNGDATALAEMLQELFGTPAAGGQGGQQGALGLQTATGGGESSLVPLRFSVDQRTNSIIASGTAGDLNVIYKILVRLDEGDIRQRITTVYRLRNSPANDVATALNQLLQNQRDLNQAAPELVSPYEQIEREVIIVPEVVSNSLIVSATPRYFEEVKRVITELDRRPPMVIIQVLIAEVALTDFDQFGLEWGLQDQLLFDRGITGGPRFAFNNAPLGNDNSAASLNTRDNVGTQGLTNFSLGRTDPALGFGGLVLSASSESVSVLIRALEQSQRLQVISRPQVQTLDNLPAFVQVGARVPRITSSSITNFGTQNSTTDENVGIILGVTPRTSPDGMIVMEVDAEKSEVGPEAEGIPISITNAGDVIRSPQILVTTAQTTVSARSGQTVILGGLITKNQSETTRRVPYLGDIPFLGRLFRFDAVSNRRTELLIILTPFIVQNDEHIDWMNQRETERMSWCIADVVNIHGPVPVAGGGEWNVPPPPVIFPDVDPTSPATISPEPTPATTPPLDLPVEPMPVPREFGLELPPGTQGGGRPTSVLVRPAEPPPMVGPPPMPQAVAPAMYLQPRMP